MEPWCTVSSTLDATTRGQLEKCDSFRLINEMTRLRLCRQRYQLPEVNPQNSCGPLFHSARSGFGAHTDASDCCRPLRCGSRRNLISVSLGGKPNFSR